MFSLQLTTLTELSLLALASAQSPSSYATPTLSGNQYVCPSPGGTYCVASSILVRCNSTSLGQTYNCNDVTADHGGEMNLNSYCYDAVPGDGNAACAISGTAYAFTTSYAIQTPTASSVSSLTTVSMLPEGTGIVMFACPSANANYCYPGADNLLVTCNGSAVGVVENCDDVLYNKQSETQYNAFCYDPIANDGQAACAISGTAYASSTTYAISTSSGSASPSPITSMSISSSVTINSGGSDIPASSSGVSMSSSITINPGGSDIPATPSSVPPQTTSILSGDAAQLSVMGIAALIGAMAMAM